MAVSSASGSTKGFNIRGRYVATPAPTAFSPSPLDGEQPASRLQLEYVYGYQGKKGRDNLFHLPNGGRDGEEVWSCCVL